MLGVRGRHLPELVGRWCGHTALPIGLRACKFAQQGLGHRMRRATQPDAVLAAADGGGYMLGARQYERKRPRPECLYQRTPFGGNRGSPIADIGFRRNMNDDGRSEERRGGKECGSTLRSRGSQLYYKTKTVHAVNKDYIQLLNI